MRTNLPAPEIALITIPAGPFTMGHVEGYQHTGREDPAHTVTLDTYQIGRYPVTNAQYRCFAQDTGHAFHDGPDDHPASGLTWQEAWLFCAWMRHKTGQPYHLPTEAEWEKAATWNPATNQKQPFPWGTESNDAYCNVLSSGPKRTTPVGFYSPHGDSPYGCADLIGNVDEWCNTALRAYPYDPSDGCEELRAEGRRAIRGGDWYTLQPSSGIERHAPSDTWRHLWGFRVALGPALEIAHQQVEQRIAGWFEGAQAEWQHQIDRDRAKAQLWYDRGAWRISLQHECGINAFQEAVQDLTEALHLATAPPKGGLLTRVRARTTLQSPLAWVYFNRAYAYLELGHYDHALIDTTQALALDPADADTFLLRAQIHSKLGDWASAHNDWEQALKRNPNHAQNQIVEAQIRMHTGASVRALECLNELIEHPISWPLHNPEAHLYRGQVYEQLGQTERALSDYCHYLLWRPAAPEAAALTQKLTNYRAGQSN